jgi:hypothetical protein
MGKGVGLEFSEKAFLDSSWIEANEPLRASAS